MSSSKSLVLVTGASGYIAGHVVRLLLQEGYRVRGTVRSLNNQEKVQHLRTLCPEAASKESLELVEADLTQDAGWTEVVRGCKFVMHTASPVIMGNTKDPMDFIRPAVDGTLMVLRACREVGGISRVVVTSSVAAINSGRDLNSEVFTEDDWSDLEKSKSDYSKSKTMAERAAWKFVSELSADEKFELSVVNPCLVLGPVLSASEAVSTQAVLQLFRGKVPMLPHTYFGIVDVRDVARAHMAAMTAPEAAGKRHILISGGMWMSEIANLFRQEFGPQGYSFPRFQAPYFLVWLMSFVDSRAGWLLGTWGQQARYNSDRMTSVLKIQPYSTRETLLDTAHSLIERGVLQKTELYKPPQPINK